MGIGGLLKRLEKFSIDNSPAVLTAFGIAGTLATAYLTGKATVKAVRLIEDNEVVLGTNNDPKERAKERLNLVWKLYIPPATSALFTVAAIYGANHVSSRRARAMATAYSISERAFTEYKDKVVEKIGEKKEQAFRDEIAQDRVSKKPVDDSVVIITNNGDVLCFDHFTGRYFKSSMEALKKAENDINYQILHQGYASLSEFYSLVGLPETATSAEVGWNTDQLLELKISTVLSQDDRPCIAIDFDLMPTRKFDRFS